jgi:hypothetical protein
MLLMMVIAAGSNPQGVVAVPQDLPALAAWWIWIKRDLSFPRVHPALRWRVP